jgi:DNA-directed RNA polymerase subunit RPC12/RpoP
MRTKLPLEAKKSRLAIKIENWFRTNKDENLTFGKLLDKYANIGESCDTVAQKFRELTRNEVDIKRSTFASAIRLVIKQKRTNFRIEAMKPRNPFRRPGSGRPPKQDKKQNNLDVLFHCHNCKEEYYTTVKMQEKDFANLQGIACDYCGEFGTGSILYQKQGIQKCRTLKEVVPGVFREKTVNPEEFRRKEVTAV